MAFNVQAKLWLLLKLMRLKVIDGRSFVLNSWKDGYTEESTRYEINLM